jgi:hypothetical protein
LVLCGRKINLEAAITMKFFGFSLFSAKADYEIPEPSAILNKSIHHPTPKPALLIDSALRFLILDRCEVKRRYHSMDRRLGT